MKLRFRQTGGFAGLSRGCEIHDQDLSPKEAARLQRLIEQSKLGEQAQRGPEGARDLAQYEITVESEGSVRTAMFDDMTIPPAAQPLLEYLQKRSGPQPLP